MICPKCGSNRVQTEAVSEITTKGKVKGFGWIKALFGWLIAGPWGILCGLCGMGKGRTKTTTKTKVIHICHTCGHQF